MHRSFAKLPGALTLLCLLSVAGYPGSAQSSAQATRTALALPPGALYAGEWLGLVAAISSSSPVTGGQVIFRDGANVIATAPVSSGIAGVSIPGLSQGTHQISAAFSGTTTASSSAAPALSLVILSAPGSAPSANPPAPGATDSAPPTVSCSSSPGSINQGDQATITATSSSPSGLPVSISFSASAGTLAPNGSSAIFTSAGASGAVQLTCTATDSLGHSASSTTSVFVNSGQGEQALTAFSFPDSVGVNVHLNYGNSAYLTNFPSFFNAIVALGVHHYRNGADPYASPQEFANAETLGKAGIKADWMIDRSDTPQDINAIYANAPDSVEAFEGPNEDNQDAGSALTGIMAMIHDTIRANPNTASAPLYNATMTNINMVGAQGNMSAYADDGNMHDYYYPRYPETPGYGGSFFGCGAYGSMAFNVCVAQVNAVGRPVVSTETGYVSGTQSDSVLAKYIVRTLFDHLSMNVMRTYIYEMLEEPNSPGYGLMNGDFTPKPAYTSIKNLISLFSDQKYSSPGKLDYTLSGQTTNLKHILFQKQDGTYMLALWLGVQSANPVAPYQTDSVPSQAVTINTNTPVGSATLSTLDDNGNLTSQSAATGNPLTVQVTDGITIVSFAPAH